MLSKATQVNMNNKVGGGAPHTHQNKFCTIKKVGPLWNCQCAFPLSITVEGYTSFRTKDKISFTKSILK